MKKFIKKINLFFVNIILVVFYLGFFGPAKILRLIFSKQLDKKNTYWQTTKLNTNLDSAF
jgi:hypothetical protein